ncbi:hypothetical protein Q5424_20920 [Conexibacter sp. JD483]|uniref:hypothetical protein n=1 Tax=unclassified Conexibacter TaxID=2627773 RepID=UPI00271F4693|nr:MULTISPECIES: hypothetical protein [unclassified Conexibacter]MDO8188379.1 hypothetical protein [Conexibacter sp. CPCC 205706]MDO8201125.1 hypothetical protein [Conexibacter sp. CPCC 205762]MDR9371575.1 hypothetical protein [Conexibacter sp. JD483]
MERWRVELPRGIEPPFEVYVNGVLQRTGDDYEVVDRVLLFTRPLTQEGRLGFWRWFWGAWGIGTYRRHHTIDVRYQRDGQTLVAHALRALPPST